MNAWFPQLQRDLRGLATLEKVASAEAVQTHAVACDRFYEGVRQAAGAPGQVKHAAANAVVRFAYEAHLTGRSLGEKVAANPALLLEKLAAAALVDEALIGETDKLAEDCRLLGREYMVELLQGLIG